MTVTLNQTVTNSSALSDLIGCSVCYRVKSRSEFGARKGSKSGLHSYCLECGRVKKREEYLRITRNKRTHEDFKRRNKEQRLKRTYGLTVEQYNYLVETQNNLCAICSTDLGDCPLVDHDHNTGKVRGLLCHPCNTGISMLKDNENNLLSAIAYLKKGEAKLNDDSV